MPFLDKILLPVDFSERSVAAARYARALVGRFESQLHLLHVLTPPQYEFGALEIGGSMLTELYRERARHAARELDAFAARELAGLSVRATVLEGEPAGKIVETAVAEQSGIVMMPTHGFGPFRRFILGSNTAKVLHDADCPVWTGVHMESAPATASLPLRNIVCAVDLGPQSSKALCWAATLARQCGAQLTIVHAIAPCTDEGDDSEVNWRVDVRAAASRELERLRQFVNVEADIVTESGEPAPAIRAAVSRLRADVLVIGRGSAAGVFGRLRMNAYALIRESPCPVVSV